MKKIDILMIIMFGGSMVFNGFTKNNTNVTLQVNTIMKKEKGEEY